MPIIPRLVGRSKARAFVAKIVGHSRPTVFACNTRTVSSLISAAFLPLRSKMSAAQSIKACLHGRIIAGCTPYAGANSDTVRALFKAFSATRGLEPSVMVLGFLHVLISCLLKAGHRQIVDSVTVRFTGRSSIRFKASQRRSNRTSTKLANFRPQSSGLVSASLRKALW